MATQRLDIIVKKLDVAMALCGLHEITRCAGILVETPWRLSAGTHLRQTACPGSLSGTRLEITLRMALPDHAPIITS